MTAIHEAPPDDALDAKRYRWLRDHSVPPHTFYVAVPEEEKHTLFKRTDVDEYIDKAIAAMEKGTSK